MRVGGMPHDAFYFSDVIPAGSPELQGERVSSLTYTGDSLLLGTQGGRLMLFRVAQSPSRGAGGRVEYSSKRERMVDVASGRSVTQLEALPDLGVLLALCNGAVTVHRLSDLGRVPSVLESKSAVSFTMKASGGQRLCICTSQNKLKLYDWVDGKFAQLKGASSDLVLPNVPRAMAYTGNRIMLGYAKEYMSLQDDTGVVKDVPGQLARDTRALCKALPGGRLMLVCAGDTGVTVESSGDPVGDANVIQFRSKPISLAWCYPYTICLGEGGSAAEAAEGSGAGELGAQVDDRSFGAAGGGLEQRERLTIEFLSSRQVVGGHP